jgi:hypothetical protein
MAGGKVFCVPAMATQAIVFDPATNTSAAVGSPGDYAGGNSFSGGCLMPDGTVAMAPLNSGDVGVFDPATNTLRKVSSSGLLPAKNSCYGAVLMSDGRAVFVPQNASTAHTYGGGPSFPMPILLGPYYNKF